MRGKNETIIGEIQGLCWRNHNCVRLTIEKLSDRKARQSDHSICEALPSDISPKTLNFDTLVGSALISRTFQGSSSARR